MKKQVLVVIGPGQIRQATARWIGAGKRIVLADKIAANAKAAAQTWMAA